MAAHTTRAKHSLNLDKMLGEKKVELDGREHDLNLREAMLAEAQTRGLNPQDDHDELMEFVELRRHLRDVEADRAAKIGRLAILLSDVSKVLVDLGVPSILGIPRDLHTAGDLLGAVDINLEHLRDDYASGHGPWD
jgi:hypothetical protein